MPKEESFELFNEPWLNRGKVARHLEDKGYNVDDVQGIFDKFKKGEAYEIIMLALSDYRDLKDREESSLNVREDHYDRIILALIMQKNMTRWLENFINGLKSFERSETETGPTVKEQYL